MYELWKEGMGGGVSRVLLSERRSSIERFVHCALEDNAAPAASTVVRVRLERNVPSPS